MTGPKVKLGLLELLRLIKLGIQNNHCDAALVVLNELIQQVEEGKKKGEQIRL